MMPDEGVAVYLKALCFGVIDQGVGSGPVVRAGAGEEGLHLHLVLCRKAAEDPLDDPRMRRRRKTPGLKRHADRIRRDGFQPGVFRNRRRFRLLGRGVPVIASEPGSFLAALEAAGLTPVDDNLPADLSTNPQNMEGYGG